jgi:hypothetical protein
LVVIGDDMSLKMQRFLVNFVSQDLMMCISWCPWVKIPFSQTYIQVSLFTRTMSLNFFNNISESWQL